MAERFDPILNYTFAREHGVVLLDVGEVTRVGVKDGSNARSVLEVRRAARKPIEIERLTPQAFERHLAEIYSVEGLGAEEISEELDGEKSLFSLLEGIPKAADLLEVDDEAPIIRLINGLISEAVKIKASDIHVEPFEQRLSVRLRIDGVLQEIASLPGRIAPLLVSRIKVMARLDIAEKRVPQDGRLSLTIGGKALDVRISTLPAQHGERVVMRLLDKSLDHFHVDQLGMGTEILAAYRKALSEPNGIVLVTGPTGSGKTTTLYAGLTQLNDKSRNILTVEDPIEYALEGIGQTQVNSKVEMTFAAGLRAILRQDPDVVMVGEIRDVETAQIAVQASLTGHLVLSTVHTNNAVGAVTRLRDMGVEPFLLASTVKAVIAQRLVRRLCGTCKQSHEPSDAERELLKVQSGQPVTLYRAAGCPACKNTGYSGRIGIYELLVVDDDVRALIHDDASEDRIAKVTSANIKTLLQSGFHQVLAGTTSIEEVLRTCRQDGGSRGSV